MNLFETLQFEIDRCEKLSKNYTGVLGLNMVNKVIDRAKYDIKRGDITAMVRSVDLLQRFKNTDFAI